MKKLNKEFIKKYMKFLTLEERMEFRRKIRVEFNKGNGEVFNG